MPTLTAILHTQNDERLLGRALESLRPCNEILVVDHGSTDGTLEVARQYGAVVLKPSDTSFLEAATGEWVLCLLPTEALSEELEGRLYEWKQAQPGTPASYALRIREETPAGWRHHSPQTRLVRRGTMHWTGNLPPCMDRAPVFPGDLLRLADARP
jgi:glycosyltransferase involved in cell wall biosynthesis